MPSLVNLNFAEGDAQTLILVLMVIMVVTVTVEHLNGAQGATDYVTEWVAAAIATALLLAISYVLPEFAVGLALVAVVTVVFTKGQVFWNAVSNLSSVSGSNSTPSSASVAAAQGGINTQTQTVPKTVPQEVNPQGGTEAYGQSNPYGPPL